MQIRNHIKSPEFKIGDLVKIRPREEISQSLKSQSVPGGCLLTDQMLEYCGRVYPVRRVVANLFDERRKRTFRPRWPFYILGDLVCDGRSVLFSHPCDHSCFLLWRQDWLEKAPENPPQDGET